MPLQERKTFWTELSRIMTQLTASLPYFHWFAKQKNIIGLLNRMNKSVFFCNLTQKH